MRLTLFISFLFHGFVSLGQLPMNLKYDGLQYSHDSATVLIYAKSKSAVFDLRTDKFLIDFTKDHLINYPKTNFYLRITSKNNSLSISDFSEAGEIVQVIDHDSSVFIGFDDPLVYPGVVSYNGILSTDFPGSASCDWSLVSAILETNQILVLNAYQKNTAFRSIDQDEWILLEGYGASGVFNPSENKWLIEPIYETCYYLNGYVFCLKKNQRTEFYVENDIPILPVYEFSWDIYQFVNEKMNLIVGDGYQLENDLLENILDVDSLIPINTEKNIFDFIKNGKHGLLWFQLYEGEGYSNPNFVGKVLIKPEFDLVVYSEMLNRLLVSQFGQTQHHTMYSLHDLSAKVSLVSHFHLTENFGYVAPEAPAVVGKEFVVCSPQSVNEKTYELISDENMNVIMKEAQGQPNFRFSSLNLSVNQMNDSLVVVNHFVADNDLRVLHSILFPEEDSITSDGNSIYYPLRPAENQSGVYDFKNEQWLITPKYTYVFQSGSGWVGVIKFGDDAIYFDLFDHFGNSVKEMLTLDNMGAYENHLFVSPYINSDTLFLAPSGYNSHLKLEISNPVYYVKTGNLLGLYQPGVFFDNLSSTDEYEFVHVHPELGIKSWIENDSLHFSCGWATASIKCDGAEIIYTCDDDSNEPYGARYLTTISDGDTIRKSIGEYSGFQQTTISIKVSANEIIVNDCTPECIVAQCTNCPYDEIFRQTYTQQIIVDSENSSVWRKTQNGWMKVSPYYASIVKLPNLEYIASSGKYYSSFALDAENPVVTDQAARYFLLDSNFHAIPFMDYFDFAYIEDLGFGLKVQFNPGEKYFFMTYDHRGITNAEWDDFELENGKLKAIIHTQYEVDEKGELVLDEFGNPIEAVSETIKYFKLR